VSETSSGATPARALNDRYFVDGGIPWVKTLDLTNSVVRATDECVTLAAVDETNLRVFPSGSVLVAMYGGFGQIGRTGLLTMPAAVNQAITAIRPHQAKLDSAFLQYVLNQRVGYWKKVASSSRKDPNIKGGDVAAFPLVLPPLCEQQAIARSLGNADELIASVEALVEKKRQVKQGAMQELLTGRRRLPGFSEEWKTKTLGQIGVFLKGSGVPRVAMDTGTLPCVRYGELYTRHSDVIRKFYSWISPEVARTATRLEYGDVLFAGSGETKEETGKAAAFVSRRDAYAGGDILILRPRGGDPVFLGYYANSRDVTRQKASLGQGDAVVHISASALAVVAGDFPDLPEQAAIGSVLSDMDADIGALEAKLAKLRLVKEGMAQDLLAGRIRLI
jgi:type I restriction enzyme, S subunit